MEVDFFGELLLAALKYKDSGFDPEIILRDETILEDTKGAVMFKEVDGRYFMRPESLPADMSIKSISVDVEGLYIEFGPLDMPSLLDLVVQEMIPLAYDKQARTFSDVHTSKKLVEFSAVQKPHKSLRARVLCTVYGDVSMNQRLVAVRLLDRLYSKNCFIPDSQERFAPTAQKMQQSVNVRLQQSLEMEQRAILSLKNQMNQTQTMSLTTSLQMLLATERRLLLMDEEQLFDFVVDHVTEHGEQRVKEILLFAFVRRVKDAAPDLSWKQARKVARGIAYKMTQKTA